MKSMDFCLLVMLIVVPKLHTIAPTYVRGVNHRRAPLHRPSDWAGGNRPSDV